MGGSTELRDECLQQCKAPSLLYGAIAYGARSTANGYAFDKNNMADAIHTAMANCQAHGDDCKIVASFSNSLCCRGGGGKQGCVFGGGGQDQSTKPVRRLEGLHPRVWQGL